MTNTRPSLDHLVAESNRLYSLPHVAAEVLRLTNSENVDATALGKCIEVDPALTSKILRVVNSSLYGLGQRVANLNQAVALLGVDALKMLVLGFSLPTQLFDGLERAVLSRFWLRTLSKAVAAQAIAGMGWKDQRDEAFLAGLLQDIGILVLAQKQGETYLAILDRAFAEDLDLSALENAALGFDHTILAARLFQGWSLPPVLVDTIASHSIGQVVDPSLPATEPLAQVLHLANLLVRFLATGKAVVFTELLSWAKHYGAPSPEDTESLIKLVEERVASWADAVAVEIDCVDYRPLLVEAQEQLAKLGEEMTAGRIRAQIPPPKPTTEFSDLFPDDFWEQSVDADGTGDAGTGKREIAADGATAQIAVDEATHAAAIELLGNSVSECRHSRTPVSLLMVDWDRAGDLRRRLGDDGFARLNQLLVLICRGLQHDRIVEYAYGPSCRILILPDCDRQPAVALGKELLARMEELASRQSTVDAKSMQLSIGSATVSLPPRNFPHDELLAAARRCLYGAQASGGGTVKSIEIY